MIDKNVIWQAFRDQANTAIGSSLSQVGGVPAIIWPSYMSGNKVAPLPPEYPYLVINVTPLNTISHSGLTSVIDDADDKTVLKRLERYLITFNCYGYSSNSIINDLHFSFDIDSARDSIRASTGGAIRSISNPLPSSTKFAERFVETSEFNIVWVAANELKDANSTIIETVNLTYNF